MISHIKFNFGISDFEFSRLFCIPTWFCPLGCRVLSARFILYHCTSSNPDPRKFDQGQQSLPDRNLLYPTKKTLVYPAEGAPLQTKNKIAHNIERISFTSNMRSHQKDRMFRHDEKCGVTSEKGV